jgi:hypothetical protein
MSRATIGELASKLDQLDLTDDQRVVLAGVMRLAGMGLESFVPACREGQVVIDPSSILRVEWHGEKVPPLSEAFVHAFGPGTGKEAPAKAGAFRIDGLVVDADVKLPAIAKRGFIAAGTKGGLTLNRR